MNVPGGASLAIAQLIDDLCADSALCYSSIFQASTAIPEQYQWKQPRMMSETIRGNGHDPKGYRRTGGQLIQP